MKKEDVFSKLPNVIEHKTNGKSYLKVNEQADKKEIYYKSEDNHVALSTLAESFENAYQSIKQKLIQNDYLKEN